MLKKQNTLRFDKYNTASSHSKRQTNLIMLIMLKDAFVVEYATHMFFSMQLLIIYCVNRIYIFIYMNRLLMLYPLDES